MISYKEYLEYEKSGFVDRRDAFVVEESSIETYSCKYSEAPIEEILKNAELINISRKDIEDDSDDEANELIYSEDFKYVYFTLATDIEQICNDIFEAGVNVKYLSIANGIEIPKSIANFKKLVYLEVQQRKVQDILEEIYKITSLEVLFLDRTDIVTVSSQIGALKNLKMFSIMHTRVTELPQELGELKELRYLGLNGLRIRYVPDAVCKLKKLKSLYLGQTLIEKLPNEIGELTELEHLAIWETKITELPDWIGNLKNLKGLYMGRTKGVCDFPETIGELENLEALYLDGTGITSLPDSFANLINLKKLMLGSTGIQKFPKLKEFPKLESCNLSDMVIERVPREFIRDSMSIYVDTIGFENNHYEQDTGELVLRGTKLLCQPISLFTHEKEFIYAYYEEEKVHLNETKVVFLGDGEAGKSHIIKRLMQDGNLLEDFKESATPGIAISSKDCCIDDECVKLQIWDFGGQEIMHSMHRFFLTERTLYVIVVNARDNMQDERAQYWLNNIKSFANGCPVILVLNKLDQNPSATLNERLLKNDYPQIAEVMKMSALNDEKVQFQYLENNILKLVKDFDSYAMDFPVSWNNIKTTLTQMEENYIIDPKYREICSNNAVVDEQIQDWLLDWFHDLGISFNYHRQDQMLAGYMVLKPDWITNAIYIILFNGRDKAQNGIIKIHDIVELLKNPPKSAKNIKYNKMEMPYILGVMRRFEISYAIDDQNEFIPMMCDRNQHEEAESFLSDNCLQYFMEYEYLPNNVLHKLMIKMRDHLDEQKIWLTGMLIKSREGNVSALIRMHGKKIEIFIKSANADIYEPKEYLSEIRNYLLIINRELNLSAEDMIVYKEGGLTEEIKYDNLLVYLSAKQKEYFSTTFRKQISIKKILGLVEHDHDVELILNYCKQNDEVSYQIIHEMLLKNQELNHPEFEELLIDCCIKLQGNTLQIKKGNENDRNTYLRDLLSVNKKYFVFDQTLNGTSANGKAAGELDLLVKNSKNQPFTVLEALNLSCIHKEYITTHINKVFTYDTWGAEKDYIVVYVENNNFADFCNRYNKFLLECEYEFPLASVEERELYTDIRIYDTVFLRNEKETKITHIVVKLQK